MTNKPMFNAANPQIIATTKTIEEAPIKTWSSSSLKKFENCPHAVFLQYVEKIPEKKSDAADRGSMIHDLAENYVNGTLTELPPELKKAEGKIEWLRAEYEKGTVILEEDWGMTTDWEPAPWVGPTTWGRAKLDAFVRIDETCAIIIDHKTGRKFGNELAHTTQGMIYAVAAFMRFPELEFIQVTFWYLDKNEELTVDYTRENAMVILPRLNMRAAALTTCTNFAPKPGPQSCRWCSYKESACEWAYQG